MNDSIKKVVYRNQQTGQFLTGEKRGRIEPTFGKLSRAKQWAYTTQKELKRDSQGMSNYYKCNLEAVVINIEFSVI